MKIVLIIVAVAIAIAVAVIVIGALVPRQHTASHSVIVRRDARTVYDTLHDFARAPEWRKELQKVDLLDPVDGRTRFRESGKYGTVTYEVMQDQPGKLLVTRIVDENLGYSGSWTYALEPVAEGTRVTITENGDIPNVIFRFMARFVFGYTATMKQYLAALQQRLT